MIEPLLLAVIYAILTHKSIMLLLKRWEVYPVLILTIVYIVLEVCIFNRIYWVLAYAGAFKALFFLSVILIAYKNKVINYYIISVVTFILGSVLNRIAISANGGVMPVFPSISYRTGYVMADTYDKIDVIQALGNPDTVRLKMLTDWIDLGYSIMSVGDILARIAVLIVFVGVIKKINKT